jgi:hypothetical protein
MPRGLLVSQSKQSSATTNTQTEPKDGALGSIPQVGSHVIGLKD